MPNIHFKAGEIICQEGYPADKVYLICEGRVEIIKKDKNSYYKLAEVGEGDVFGEMAVIDLKPRSATVKAIEETWCYSLGRDSFLQKFNNASPRMKKIFEDLVNVIREKSSPEYLIDHGQILSLDADENIEKSSTEIIPPISKEKLLSDKNIQQEIENLDLFIRKVFENLVRIAYS